MPRKFKIAITGAATDRAAIQLHDIGLQLVEGTMAVERGLQGLGWRRHGPHARHRESPAGVSAARTLLSYLESILRVYNLQGRRDNIHRARIKILVNTLGVQRFRANWWRPSGEQIRAIHIGGLATPSSGVCKRFSRRRTTSTADRRMISDEHFRQQPVFRRLVSTQHSRAQDPRLSNRHGVIEGARA